MGEGDDGDCAVAPHSQQLPPRPKCVLYAAIMTSACSALVFLRRVHLWLRLLWGRGAVVAAPCCVPAASMPNRAAARLEQRSLPAARQGCALDGMLYRAHGRAYYLRWIYDYGLSGRVRWCFMDWNWRWPVRLVFKDCGPIHSASAICHAPLSPD